ncbi:MAG: excinuclease ABC subunit UvrB, partial [Anaerolineae bacterium]
PEAYVATTDTYIEKDTSINDEIDRLRLAATSALFSRRDVLIVASVSSIYGLGSPSVYGQVVVRLVTGERRDRTKLLRHLVDIQYSRNDYELTRGTFRARGDTLEIQPAYEESAYRIELFGDEVERITRVDRVTGEVLEVLPSLEIFPARHFITPQDNLVHAMETIEAELKHRLSELTAAGKLLEAQRLESRTHYDLEMMREIGYCTGIENYSRHLTGRGEGEPPWTLLDYFPDDFLVFTDESHMTLPQIAGMYAGDRSRKETLVQHGFRLPSALDNRPLTFEEWQARVHQAVFVSATPGPHEEETAKQTVELIIRPTGLVDPQVIVRPSAGQVDDLLGLIRERVAAGQRALVTTLTKRMSEDLADYLLELGVKVHYLHSEVQTLERVEILRDLRFGVYDVVVGINLLREGLDLPEVSLVAILDADKSGFLRSATALIQTIGRAARHADGTVVMYADRETDAMRQAIDETNRRRAKQIAFNQAHGITPQTIQKEVHDLTQRVRQLAAEADGVAVATDNMPKAELADLVRDLEKEMRHAAKELEFERAAALRDQIRDLRETLRIMDGRPEWVRLRDEDGARTLDSPPSPQ